MVLAAVALLGMVGTAEAHFVFVVPDAARATAMVVLSEDLTPDDDVDIDLIANAKIFLRQAGGKDVPLDLRKDRSAYVVAIAGEGTRVIHGVVDLGVMRRGNSKPFLLIYHPKTIIAAAFDPHATLGKPTPVEIVPVGKPGELRFEVLVEGRPRENIEVNVILPDGSRAKSSTDQEGRTTGVYALPGRYGAWARYAEQRSGEKDGKKYDEIRHYPTLVVDVGAIP